MPRNSFTRRAVLGVALAAAVTTKMRAAVRSDDEFTHAAEAMVDRAASEDGFSGVILVAQGTQVLLRRAAGFADRERKIPITPQTELPLESVTKQFTAAGIMILVQDCSVALSDEIAKYYPASPPAWKGVTIKHLLNHTSGIRDYWQVHSEAQQKLGDGTLFKSFRDLIQLSLGDPLGFQPGQDFIYSNTGYALLAVVIEVASRERYGDFLQKRIFSPLGMKRTGYGDAKRDHINGYVLSAQGTWQSTGPDVLNVQGGFGGIYSTVDDMLTWSQALEGDLILLRASRDAMFQDNANNYSSGWRFAPKFGQRLIWHTGSNSIFTSIFDRFPIEQLTVVAMSNANVPTSETATLLIEGKLQTFPANAQRKLVEQVERLYFDREP